MQERNICATSPTRSTLGEIAGHIRRFEMNKIQKNIKVVSILLLIQTVIWLVFTIISMSDVKPNWTTMDYVRWVSEPNIFFIGIKIGNKIIVKIVNILEQLIVKVMDLIVGEVNKINFIYPTHL